MSAGRENDQVSITMRDVTEWSITVPSPMATTLTAEQIEANGDVLAVMAQQAVANRTARADRGPKRTEFVSAAAVPGVQAAEAVLDEREDVDR